MFLASFTKVATFIPLKLRYRMVFALVLGGRRRSDRLSYPFNLHVQCSNGCHLPPGVQFARLPPITCKQHIRFSLILLISFPFKGFL